MRRMRKWSVGDVVVRVLAASAVLYGLTQYIDAHRPHVAAKNEYGVAVMPAMLIGAQVRDLKPQESGWVVPWAISVTETGSCWLDSQASVYQKKSGSARVQITNSRQGFTARSYYRGYRWERVPNFKIDGYYPVWSFTY